MTPVPAVEPVAGALGPLLTLQALAEVLGAGALLPPAEAAAHDQASAAGTQTTGDGGGPAGAQAAPQVHVDLPGPAATAALAAQAHSGRATLGQLAAEQAQWRKPLEAASAEPPAAWVPGGMDQGAVLPQALAVPVLQNPLQPSPTAEAQARATPQQTTLLAPRPLVQRRPRRTGRPAQPALGSDEEPAAEPVEPEAEDQADADAEDDAAESRPAAPDTPPAALHALLLQAGDPTAAAVLAELDRRRRVLLVLPRALPQQGAVLAQAWLVATQQAWCFHARWWPGIGVPAPGWPMWRVFRNGDADLARGLSSRAAGQACRVRLGTQPLRLADVAAAALELPERIRFVKALGGQWSVLLVAAPPFVQPAA